MLAMKKQTQRSWGVGWGSHRAAQKADGPSPGLRCSPSEQGRGPRLPGRSRWRCRPAAAGAGRLHCVGKLPTWHPLTQASAGPKTLASLCLFWAQRLSNRVGSLRTLPTLTFSEVKNRPRLPLGPTASLLDIGGAQLWFQSCDSSGTVLPESCIEPCLKCSCLSPMSREVALGRGPGDYLQWKLQNLQEMSQACVQRNISPRLVCGSPETVPCFTRYPLLYTWENSELL